MGAAIPIRWSRRRGVGKGRASGRMPRPWQGGVTPSSQAGPQLRRYLLPFQPLQPVLRQNQLALLGRLSLAYHEEMLPVGGQAVGRDRARAGELRDREE